MSETHVPDVAVPAEVEQVKEEKTTVAEQKPSEAATGAEQNGTSAKHDEKNGEIESLKQSVEVPPTRQGRKGKNNDNIKSTYNLPESSDPVEILRQLEFYFSEANLPMDEYLFNKVGGSRNVPFPLKELHTFKRMKHFQPYTAVLEAAKSSKVLDVNDDGEVYRKEPLSEEYGSNMTENRRTYERKSEPRTVYAKGFGPESEDTQTQVEEFFAPYGEVTAVRLRRHSDKAFKGSATIEFADEATATKFLALETKPLWQGSTTLELRSKKEWADEKNEYYNSRRNNKSYSDSKGRRNDRDSHHNGRGGKFQKRGGKGGDRDHRRRTDERSSEKKAEAVVADTKDDAVSTSASAKRAREPEANEPEGKEPESKKTKVDVPAAA